MSQYPEETVILAGRCTNVAGVVPGSLIVVCNGGCSSRCWVSPETRRAAPHARVLCVECAEHELARRDDLRVDVTPGMARERAMHASPPRVCAKCGCTNDNPCPGGCKWVNETTCSRCVEIRPPAPEPEIPEPLFLRAGPLEENEPACRGCLGSLGHPRNEHALLELKNHLCQRCIDAGQQFVVWLASPDGNCISETRIGKATLYWAEELAPGKDHSLTAWPHQALAVSAAMGCSNAQVRARTLGKHGGVFLLQELPGETQHGATIMIGFGRYKLLGSRV